MHVVFGNQCRAERRGDKAKGEAEKMLGLLAGLDDEDPVPDDWESQCNAPKIIAQCLNSPETINERVVSRLKLISMVGSGHYCGCGNLARIYKQLLMCSAEAIEVKARGVSTFSGLKGLASSI